MGLGLLAAAVITAAPAIAAAQSRCPAESSQFDFWAGEWSVEETGQPGKPVASSREEKIAGGCALLESYEEPDGYSGKSVNFYDPVLKKWRQTWADSAGNVSEFSGELRDGAMRFEGESHTASGERVYRRLTFTPLAEGSVRQRSEASLDGKTWKVNYDYRYVRKNGAS
ncbi:MAG TPA: hypothetical protein VG777_01255 [Thermoanaerobaculia bacterium]|nr:hypothetical protein [Thermoanaerobaculia bacterium]